MDMEETVPYDNEAILAESRLMDDVKNVFYTYMRSPHARMETFAILLKECITSVMPWRSFLRYK